MPSTGSFLSAVPCPAELEDDGDRRAPSALTAPLLTPRSRRCRRAADAEPGGTRRDERFARGASHGCRGGQRGRADPAAELSPRRPPQRPRGSPGRPRCGTRRVPAACPASLSRCLLRGVRAPLGWKCVSVSRLADACPNLAVSPPRSLRGLRVSPCSRGTLGRGREEGPRAGCSHSLQFAPCVTAGPCGHLLRQQLSGRRD